MPHLTVIRLLRSLGVELGLDWDDELLIGCPDLIFGATVEEIVREHTDQIRTELAAAGRRAMRQFVGGPLNGKPHIVYYHPGAYRGFRQGPRRWAVYEFQQDGRAMFRGWATSEKKARRGVLIDKAKG